MHINSVLYTETSESLTRDTYTQTSTIISSYFQRACKKKRGQGDKKAEMMREESFMEETQGEVTSGVGEVLIKKTHGVGEALMEETQGREEVEKTQ